LIKEMLFSCLALTTILLDSNDHAISSIASVWTRRPSDEAVLSFSSMSVLVAELQMQAEKVGEVCVPKCINRY
jgi:hypothetical protein